MKTPTNIGGNNLALFLQSATELRMADLYTITLANGFTGTRVQTSGGTSTLKYFYSFGAGLSGVSYFISISVKNQGSAQMRVGSNYTEGPFIQPGQQQLVTFNITGNGTTQVQLRFEANAASDPLDVIASDPIIQQAASENKIPPAQQTFSGGAWANFSGCVTTLTQNQTAPQNVIRYTTWDTNLGVNGNMFLTGPPNIKRSHIEEKIGLDVSAIDLEISAGASDVLPNTSTPILQAIAMGLLDGASLKIERLFMDASGNQIGTVVRFSGIIGEVDEVGRSSAKLSVHALTELLTQQLPNIILQPNCTNTLFDARCGLAKSSFGENNVAQAGSTVNKVLSGSSKTDGYYDNGQITFTSGANAGLTKAVKQYFGQQFVFNSPLPFAPSAGDTFVAYPGCDKTQGTCTSKFNNLANFEGFPYIPSPETAI